MLVIGRESWITALGRLGKRRPTSRSVQLFAVFHDSCRVNEGYDDGHGERGGDLAFELRYKLFVLSYEEFDLLYEACAGHTDGTDGRPCHDSEIAGMPTAWAGWVGICPHPGNSARQTVKRPEILKWADGRACFEVVPDFVKGEWVIDTTNWAQR